MRITDKVRQFRDTRCLYSRYEVRGTRYVNVTAARKKYKPLVKTSRPLVLKKKKDFSLEKSSFHFMVC